MIFVRVAWMFSRIRCFVEYLTEKILLWLYWTFIWSYEALLNRVFAEAEWSLLTSNSKVLKIICKRQIHKGCSKSNASCFIMSAHDIRGRCCWYGSWGWTFSPIFYYILLLCDRWQQRGSLTKWHLIWRCIWIKGVSLISSLWEKLYLLIFIYACWVLIDTKQ